MPASIRQNKVSSQIQRIVATVLQRDIADPRVDGLISVTRVEITRDLREAKVYLSILAAKRPAATVVEGIKSAGRHIQAEVADKLPLRYAPRLTFYSGRLAEEAGGDSQGHRRLHRRAAPDASRNAHRRWNGAIGLLIAASSSRHTTMKGKNPHE